MKLMRAIPVAIFTTACVKSKGLSDDCIELSTLRKFRDEYILNLENGEKDIKEYYDTAPYR